MNLENSSSPPSSHTKAHDRTLSPQIQALLSSPGSLTEILRQHYASVFVRRLSESFHQGYWVRDVLIMGDDVPRVLARTTIDREEFEQLPELATLGDKPLGDWLFQQPSCEIVSFSLHQGNGFVVPSRERVFRVRGVVIHIHEMILDRDHA